MDGALVVFFDDAPDDVDADAGAGAVAGFGGKKRREDFRGVPFFDTDTVIGDLDDTFVGKLAQLQFDDRVISEFFIPIGKQVPAFLAGFVGVIADIVNSFDDLAEHAVNGIVLAEVNR